MNKLQHESSPYLLQHAHNPVDWYAWSQEAFDTALKEDKPLLVSIGYSTCHWCHVMERESFEDPEVAEFMNTQFVCIKVDREERPDVDQIYMEACQILNGSGGWPLNVFLTRDLKPFYAGTYYPPMPAHTRPSWLQVLMTMSHAWHHRRRDVESQADRLMEVISSSEKQALANRMKVESEACPFDRRMLEDIRHNLLQQADSQNGGFGGAPKFPSTMSLAYLLAYHYHFGTEAELRHVVLSLDKMARGGIYDHLGGGFSRYATDSHWLIPHFEKMLYDNALLVSLYVDAFKYTGKPRYRQVVIETLEWVLREMTHPEGGFYSALDADSEGVEGEYYVWEKAEIEAVLGAEATLFCDYYGVAEGGNWEGRNILYRPQPLEVFASQRGVEPEALESSLHDYRQRLFEHRSCRVRPGLDDKVLLGWNALMASAFVHAFHTTADEKYLQTALGNLNFLLESMRQPEGLGLFHSWKDGGAHIEAFLDDYAFLIEALINAYQATFDDHWLLQASRYTGYVLDNFFDDKDKLFYFSSANHQDVPLRKKSHFDSATPSGNSVMVRNLQRLGLFFGNDEYRRLATDMLYALRESLVKFPAAFGNWTIALMSEIQGQTEIAVVGADFEKVGWNIQQRYLPHSVIMAAKDANTTYPLLDLKEAPNTDTLIYVCQNYACLQPVSSMVEFDKMMGRSQIPLNV